MSNREVCEQTGPRKQVLLLHCLRMHAGPEMPDAGTSAGVATHQENGVLHARNLRSGPPGVAKDSSVMQQDSAESLMSACRATCT